MIHQFESEVVFSQIDIVSRYCGPTRDATLVIVEVCDLPTYVILERWSWCFQFTNSFRGHQL